MDESAFFVLQTEKGKCHMTISKITKKNFSIFLKTEVQMVQARQHLDAFSADPSCWESVCKNLMAAV